MVAEHELVEMSGGPELAEGARRMGVCLPRRSW